MSCEVVLIEEREKKWSFAIRVEMDAYSWVKISIKTK